MWSFGHCCAPRATNAPRSRRRGSRWPRSGDKSSSPEGHRGRIRRRGEGRGEGDRRGGTANVVGLGFYSAAVYDASCNSLFLSMYPVFSAMIDSTVSTRSCASFGCFWKKFTHSQRVALVSSIFVVRQSCSSVSGCCLSSSKNWILLEMT